MVYYISSINWKRNFKFPENTTITEATEYGIQGLDAGNWGAIQIKPKDKNDVEGYIMWEGYLLKMIEFLGQKYTCKEYQ